MGLETRDIWDVEKGSLPLKPADIHWRRASFGSALCPRVCARSLRMLCKISTCSAAATLTHTPADSSRLSHCFRDFRAAALAAEGDGKLKLCKAINVRGCCRAAEQADNACVLDGFELETDGGREAIAAPERAVVTCLRVLLLINVALSCALQRRQRSRQLCWRKMHMHILTEDMSNARQKWLQRKANQPSLQFFAILL